MPLTSKQVDEFVELTLKKLRSTYREELGKIGREYRAALDARRSDCTPERILGGA